ncbi:MAG: acyl-CoA dehydrogenase family protein [Trebonia sp.]|jgi:alkylation response protein AidB-like acyl-CoA dehydrogenase
MDFSLTDTQQEIARLAGQLLDDEKADPWQELAQSGLLALSLPAELGGEGIGVMDMAVLLAEIGRRAVPVPALATLMTGVLPIARWGDGDLRRTLLPPAAAGETILTAGIREPSDPLPRVPAVTVTGGTVSGTKVGVPYCEQAAHVLLPVTFAAPPQGAGPPGWGVSAPHPSRGVVIIDPTAAGAHVTRTPSAAGTPEYTLRLDRVRVEHVLGGADCLQDLSQLAVAGACCLADGALSAALALTRNHVASRRQFGRPLATFQAVAQQIADVYIASRTLHLATLSACWLLDMGRDAAVDLGVAGYWCAHEAPRSVRTCHHLHGGTGMDTTYPLHHFSALISDLVRSLGGADYQLERQACSST